MIRRSLGALSAWRKRKAAKRPRWLTVFEICAHLGCRFNEAEFGAEVVDFEKKQVWLTDSKRKATDPRKRFCVPLPDTLAEHLKKVLKDGKRTAPPAHRVGGAEPPVQYHAQEGDGRDKSLTAGLVHHALPSCRAERKPGYATCKSQHADGSCDPLEIEYQIWHIPRLDGTTFEHRGHKFRFAGNFDVSQPTGS